MNDNTNTPTDTRNFANHPQSISEIRSKKSENASDWTPRDALIATLRDIDSGSMECHSIVIALGRRNPDGSTSTAYFQSTANFWESLGLIESAKLKIMGLA